LKKEVANMGNETREKIAKAAYEIYESSGREPGKDLQNWLMAEKSVLSKQSTGEDRNPDGPRRVAPARKKRK
jgi:hypothetical protein